jgi:hypothetical protein
MVPQEKRKKDGETSAVSVSLVGSGVPVRAFDSDQGTIGRKKNATTHRIARIAIPTNRQRVVLGTREAESSMASSLEILLNLLLPLFRARPNDRPYDVRTSRSKLPP